MSKVILWNLNTVLLFEMFVTNTLTSSPANRVAVVALFDKSVPIDCSPPS